MWTKEKISDLVAAIPYGDTKLHSLLLELAATSAAVENLQRTPQTVWFQAGFTPEQHTQRVVIVNIARDILAGHKEQWLADLLNTFNIPAP